MPAARFGPLRACSVADEVAALALVSSWADRNMRQALERAVAPAGGAASHPHTYRTRMGACRSRLNGPLTRVATGVAPTCRCGQGLRPQAADILRDLNFLGHLGNRGQ
jgi:hypothetical protein